MKELQEKLGRKVSPSQIYPFLKALKKKNYISFGEQGKREKKPYSLTPEGRKFVSEMSLRLGSFIDAAVQSKLITCAHCGCKIYEGAYVQKIKGKLLKFCCSKCAEAFLRE